MVKKLVLVLLLSTFFCGVRAETQEDVTPLLQQVDLVVFILERNAVRMERYGLHELQSNNLSISKDISAQHSVFKISMTEEKSKARDMFWDMSSDGCVKIISGAKRTPKNYYLLLKKIMSPDVCMENCTKICFDCAVARAQVVQEDSATAKPEWISTIEIIVPAGEDKVALQLTWNGKIDAACGLFVQHELFEGQTPVLGKLKREEALAQGILVTENEKQRGAQAEQDAVVSDGATSPWSTAKKALWNALAKIKNLCVVSWQKVVGCCGAH